MQTKLDNKPMSEIKPSEQPSNHTTSVSITAQSLTNTWPLSGDYSVVDVHSGEVVWQLTVTPEQHLATSGQSPPVENSATPQPSLSGLVQPISAIDVFIGYVIGFVAAILFFGNR